MKKLFAILLVLLVPTFCLAGSSEPPGQNNNQNNSNNQNNTQTNEQRQYNNQWNNQSTYQWTNQNQKVIANPTLNANPIININPEPTPVVVEGDSLSIGQPSIMMEDKGVLVENPAADLGLNRQFVQPYNQAFPNTIQYNGPFDQIGWNMFADTGLLPREITKAQAESLSEMDTIKVNGIKVKVSLLVKQRYEYDKYSISGKPIGKLIGIAYIKDAEFTSKGIAVAGLVAMSRGANKIMIFAVYQYTPKSTTVGLGGGGDVAALRGDKMQNSLNGGTAIGYAHSWGSVEVIQGLVVLMYEE